MLLSRPVDLGESKDGNESQLSTTSYVSFKNAETLLKNSLLNRSRSESEQRPDRNTFEQVSNESSDSIPPLRSLGDHSDRYVETQKIQETGTKDPPHLQKRIIVCCDGTWNDGLDSCHQKSTNVLRLARSIFSEDRQTSPSIPQLVFYQTGLGTTDTATLNLTQGATGAGVLAKVKEAYAFIAQNYFPGDEVFLFGFSRGAFTARTIAALIADLGILTNAGMAQFYQVFSAYQLRGKGTVESEDAEKFLDNYRRGGSKRVRAMPPGTLKCVGVWDTVGAFGVPNSNGKLYRILGFHDTELSNQISYAFHAMAIHETRGEFKPTKWRKKPQSPGTEDFQVFKQVWFSGSHSDVGGGNKDDDLSTVALFWMVANLIEYKLLAIDENYLLSLITPENDWGKQKPTDSRTGVMVLSTEAARKVPTVFDKFTREKLHRSVEVQPNLETRLIEIFKSKNQGMIEELLPFETKMKQKWYEFQMRSSIPSKVGVNSPNYSDLFPEDEENESEEALFNGLSCRIFGSYELRNLRFIGEEIIGLFDEIDKDVEPKAIATPIPPTLVEEEVPLDKKIPVKLCLVRRLVKKALQKTRISKELS